ncbi:hypothetical protein ACHAWF_002962 [Thalassiosira exigua]
MCPPGPGVKDNTKALKALVGLLGLSTLGLLAATLALAVQGGGSPPPPATESAAGASDFLASRKQSSFFSTLEDNACAGARLALDNKLCADLQVAPQAGANVTKGYVGNLDPNTKHYFESSMCPVNVHWHLGSEHYSWGEFDEGGDGPNGNQPRLDWARRARDLAAGVQVRDGFRCRHYDRTDIKSTAPYDWKYCVGMEVGETYETIEAQDVAGAVGVHGQVFTVVNDEAYFYPDMIRGMIRDGPQDMGQDVAIYTGSTTGESRTNEVCSQYAPITWLVDRKCHVISASSFDKLCLDMLMQRDNMSGDLYPHGSRELVHDDLAADNQYYPEAEAAPDEPAVEAASEVPADGGNRNLRA